MDSAKAEILGMEAQEMVPFAVFRMGLEACFLILKVLLMFEFAIGTHVLEADRQTPEHDRHISNVIARSVLRRDGYACQNCGWSHEEWNRSDPRHLELHHIKPISQGGESVAENLVTLCNICHDEIHKKVK